MNNLYTINQRVLIALFTWYTLTSSLISFAEIDPKKQLLPHVSAATALKLTLKIKQIIESALSFENAIQNIQAFVGNDEERKDFIVLKEGEIINLLLKRFNLINNFQEAQSKLFELAQSGKGSKLAIDALKKSVADLNQLDAAGNTALIIATQGKHKDMVGWLIDAGIDVNIPNKNGSTALSTASLLGSNDIFALLMKAQPNVNTQNNLGMTPLMQAAIKGNKEIVRQLINNGADVNMKNSSRKTALIIASQLSRTTGDPDREDIVRQLIEAGAHLNLRDLQDKTALEYTKNERIKKILTEAIKQTHAKDIFRAIESIDQTQKDLFQLEERKKHGATVQKQLDAKIRELQGKLNHFKLFAQKVTLNITDDQGYTPLHRAVQSGNEDLVGLILVAQPQLIMKKSNLGQTPFELAVGLGREKLIKLFKELLPKNNSNEGKI